MSGCRPDSRTLRSIAIYIAVRSLYCISTEVRQGHTLLSCRLRSGQLVAPPLCNLLCPLPRAPPEAACTLATQAHKDTRANLAMANAADMTVVMHWRVAAHGMTWDVIGGT